MHTHDLLKLGPVIPVIVIDDARHAVPLARALVDGGVKVLEVTLRTPASLQAIRLIADEVPEVIVGAGTLTSPEMMDQVRQAGARFGVSPGATRELLEAGRDWAFLPGVMTPSDILRALAAGYDRLKFFPAAQAGGTAMLKTFHGVFPGLRFCPTGGIDARNAAEFLSQPNVDCVGGSWLAPAKALKAEDWDGITELARQAQQLSARPA